MGDRRPEAAGTRGSREKHDMRHGSRIVAAEDRLKKSLAFSSISGFRMILTA
jgi:hypothetical protein